MAEHTPGPWEVSNSPRGAIAKLTSNSGHADAELLAAAPMLLEQRNELLAALESLGGIEGGGHCFCFETWRDPRRESHSTRCRRAVAAIAKARGENQEPTERECLSPVCLTMVCVTCGECPNRCGFDEDDDSPHDECVKTKGESDG